MTVEAGNWEDPSDPKFVRIVHENNRWMLLLEVLRMNLEVTDKVLQ